MLEIIEELGVATLIPFLVLFVVVVSQIVKILREYERGVIFTIGRVGRNASGPGLVLLVPVIQQMVKVDMRTLVHDVPTQDVISLDNVSVKVNAVIYYRVLDAVRAITQVENFMAATSQLAQTTLRSVLGKHELDEMLAERDKLNRDIQEVLDAQTEAWGIKVSNVEIKHVDIDPSMVRAIAKQAEAERERRAKVISAEGEQQAAAKLAEAADILSENEASMQLRYLGALQEIANDRSNTIVFPFSLQDLKKTLGRD
ncbi:MAG: slipin family protein [Pseudomonadota bacterium]